MINKRYTIIIIFIILISNVIYADDYDVLLEKKIENADEVKVVKYTERLFDVTFNRAFHFSLKFANSPEHSDEKKLALKQSLAAYIFNYWFLKELGYIEGDHRMQTLVKEALANKDLNIQLFQDPLLRFDTTDTTFSISGPRLTDKEYQIIVRKFVKDYM